MKKRLIIGITGASGSALAWDCLEELKKHEEIESCLILTDSAKRTIELECDRSVDEFEALADKVFSNDDISAGPASGTYETIGMLVVPCSMKTAAGIHSGYSDNLLLRAADVTIKEQRRLVLCARETPLSTIHLRCLYELSQIQGVMIVPPMMVHYNKAKDIHEMEHHITAKLLSYFGIACSDYKRWGS